MNEFLPKNKMPDQAFPEPIVLSVFGFLHAGFRRKNHRNKPFEQPFALEGCKVNLRAKRRKSF